MERRLTFKTRAALAKMTLSEAYVIQTWLAEQEFPGIFSASIFFALFKVSVSPGIIQVPARTKSLQMLKIILHAVDIRHPVRIPVARRYGAVRKTGRHSNHVKTGSRHQRLAHQHDRPAARVKAGDRGCCTHQLPPWQLPKGGEDL